MRWGAINNLLLLLQLSVGTLKPIMQNISKQLEYCGAKMWCRTELKDGCDELFLYKSNANMMPD